MYNDLHPKNTLEQTYRLAHRRLDVQRLHVLPVLLEERDEEVDAQHDVSKHLILSHLDVADGDTQAEDLLELELDRGANLDDLVVKVLRVRDGGGEFAGCRRAIFKTAAPELARCCYSPLERPGPSKRGICLMRASEDRKASYFLASFLTSFLFLLSLRNGQSQ